MDHLKRECRDLKFLDHPGPPWYIYRTIGEDYHWYSIPCGDLSSAEAAIRAVDVGFEAGIKCLKSKRLSFSRALEMGERRR